MESLAVLAGNVQIAPRASLGVEERPDTRVEIGLLLRPARRGLGDRAESRHEEEPRTAACFIPLLRGSGGRLRVADAVGQWGPARPTGSDAFYWETEEEEVQRSLVITSVALAALLGARSGSAQVAAQVSTPALAPIPLPAPQTDGGMPS